MAISAQAPDIQGERQSGQDVRTQNVMACQAVANIVKSSLGLVGLDKMQVLVGLAELQDRELVTAEDDNDHSINVWKDRRRCGGTRAERGGGICCSGRACRRSQRRRTCSKQSEYPPLLKAPRRRRETEDEERSNRKE
ncbi:hypothetical protein SLEP1_g58278 [Rubroshorea leprosula]|uniref:Uncharacterized protein n=1 Tax=Rubroshorea leprosula TaxID=152421 RepID=A0AAV5MTC6_9ROSI|nr:hypothetical protein SLEP1_g58278 [Rubroshorea leprosula]